MILLGSGQSKCGEMEKVALDQDLALKYKEAEQFRRFAFLGVTFSTVAVIMSVISVPMVYNYVQTVHAMVKEEVEFCNVSMHCILGIAITFYWFR